MDDAVTTDGFFKKKNRTITLKWVTDYNLAAVNILGPPAKVKCVCGERLNYGV